MLGTIHSVLLGEEDRWLVIAGGANFLAVVLAAVVAVVAVVAEVAVAAVAAAAVWGTTDTPLIPGENVVLRTIALDV